MAKEEFKKKMTQRFNEVVKFLKENGYAKTNTDIGALIGQPLQAVSKLISGERIITLEQASLLSANSPINSFWLLTGQGEIEAYPNIENLFYEQDGVKISVDEIYNWIIKNEKSILNHNSFRTWISQKVYKGLSDIGENLQSK